MLVKLKINSKPTLFNEKTIKPFSQSANQAGELFETALDDVVKAEVESMGFAPTAVAARAWSRTFRSFESLELGLEVDMGELLISSIASDVNCESNSVNHR
jgi:hypothetical protein